MGALTVRLVIPGLAVTGPDPLAVSLNGLPPGEPVIGDLAPEPGHPDQEITVMVSYPDGYDPAALDGRVPSGPTRTSGA